MTADRTIEMFRAEWRGIPLDISYEAKWMGSIVTAHLEIWSVVPLIAIPITDTGYKSHFIHPHYVDAAGGPVAFVLSWLDVAAKSPVWVKAEFAARQGSLF